MYCRGVRGAITIEDDTPAAIEKATVELFAKILDVNKIEIEDISHIIFTSTSDIYSAYPAKFLRKNFHVDYVPLLCTNEMDVKLSLKKCIRILIVINTEKKQKEIKHVYLGGAKILRSDIIG